MSNWSSGIITARGLALQAKVEAGQTKLEFIKMKLGTGVSRAEDVTGFIDLKEPRETLKITSVSINDDRSVRVMSVLDTSTIDRAFEARELGLFAKDPDIGDILYAVNLDSTPDTVINRNAAAHETIEYAMNIVISNAENVVINVNPEGLVTNNVFENTFGIVKRVHFYREGDLLYDKSFARHDFRLRCIRSGTTDEPLLDLSHAKIGDIIEDGTVQWKVVSLQASDDVGSYVSLDTASTIDFSLGYGTQGVYMITPDA